MLLSEQSRVLIVDDDHDGAESIADLIDARGCRVATAHNTRDALARLAEFAPQVMLVDLRLGQENGLDLIGRIKEIDPDLICLVVTANADKESAVGALRRGAYDYLTKPVDPEELFQALQRAFDVVQLMLDNRRMIQELQAAKGYAEKLALNDSLTGLANRHAFQTQLDQAISQTRRLGKLAAILILDLDGFKQVNDTHGHQMGDQLLQRIAERLKTCVRCTDSVARLGGDEFAVTLVNLDSFEDVRRPADLILRCICKPIMIDGITVEVGASIGVSLCPLDADEAGELMRRADVALYAAKAAGRGTMRCYDAELDARTQEQHRLERDLKRAYVNGEFELHFQAQICLSSDTVGGVEALLRWCHPHHGVLLPAAFIEQAESSGLIVDLGRWVIQTACRQAQRWADQGLPPMRMAVNISPRQLRNEVLVDAVETALDETGLPPTCLELELTENAVLGDEQEIAAKLHRLRTLGVQLAIDDFGTGHSSLARLKEYPINRLKIDQSFVRNLTTNQDDQAICCAALQLGASLGLDTVAEGVETREQLDFLRASGCGEAQGYYFSEPLPAHEFERWFCRRSLESVPQIAL